MTKDVVLSGQVANMSGRNHRIRISGSILLGLVVTSILIILTGCGGGLAFTPSSGAAADQETLTLPTAAPTAEPTALATRVLPIEVLTPLPTPSVTPIPDEVLGLVVDVIDGDTIAVILDGDPASQAYEVRSLGVDAPENGAGEPWGVVAYERNQDLTKLRIVRLVRDGPDFDDDGFLLRHVYIDKQLLSVVMAEQGLVRAAGEANLRFARQIREAEAQARQARLGLWGQRAPTPTDSADETAPAEEASPTVTVTAGTPSITVTTAAGTEEPETESTEELAPSGTITGTVTTTPQATTVSTPVSGSSSLSP
jgi:endonuclease YncB( thermonuclease family)